MKNLRCHKILELDAISGSTNFVIGANGSGKSTVVLAVQLALGLALPDDKAGVVRREAESREAVAEVDLCNSGAHGTTHAPELYGDVITLSRKIKMSDTTPIKLTATLTIRGSPRPGKPVFTLTGADAKRELEKLQSIFNFSADNPVMIMDQETSKKFLTGDSQLQFQYFLRATNLSRLYDSASELKWKLKETHDALVHHARSIVALEEDAAVKANKFKDIKSLALFRAKILAAEKNLLWAAVLEKEATLPAFKADAVDTRRTLDDVRARLEQLDAGRKKFMDVKIAAEAALDLANANAHALRSDLDSAEAAFKLACRPLDAAMKSNKTANAALIDARKVHAKAAAEVDAVETRIASAERTTKRSAAERTKTSAVEKLTLINKEYNAHLDASGNVEEAAAAADGAARKAEEDRAAAGRARTAAADRVKAAAQANPDRLAPFERATWDRARSAAAIARLCIANPCEFREIPIGPLGTVCTLKDPAWDKAFDSFARTDLIKFLVTSPEDAAALERLVKTKLPAHKDALTYSLLQGSATARRAAANVGGGKTLLDAIDPGPPSAANYLMDVLFMDRTLLAADRNAASVALNKAAGTTAKSVLTLEMYEVSISRAGNVSNRYMGNENISNGLVRGASAESDRAAAAAAATAAEGAYALAANRAAFFTAEAKTAAAEHKSTLDFIASNGAKRTAAEVALKRADEALRKAIDEEDDSGGVDEAARAAAEADVVAAREVVTEREAEVALCEEAKKAAQPGIAAAKAAVEVILAKMESPEAANAAAAVVKVDFGLEKFAAGRMQMETKENDFLDKVRAADIRLLTHATTCEEERAAARTKTLMAEPAGDGPDTVAKARGELTSYTLKLDAERQKHSGVDPVALEDEWKAAAVKAATERQRHSAVQLNLELLEVQKKAILRKFKEQREEAEQVGENGSGERGAKRERAQGRSSLRVALGSHASRLCLTPPPPLPECQQILPYPNARKRPRRLHQLQTRRQQSGRRRGQLTRLHRHQSDP